MEEFGVWAGELEIRQRGSARILSGSFPYGKLATVADRGRRRKERIEPGAFDFQLDRFAEVAREIQAIQSQAVAEVIEEQRAANTSERLDELQEALERANVHILRGHDFNQPLGDMKRGTARVESTREAIEFEVDLPPDEDLPTYFADAIKEVRNGRAGGISPGFRMPPSNVVPGAEVDIPEPGNPSVSIRVIRQAVLYELSIVSRPAYGSTDVDLRAEVHAKANEGRDRRPSTRTIWL